MRDSLPYQDYMAIEEIRQDPLLLVYVPLSWAFCSRSFFKSFIEMVSPPILQEVHDKWGFRVRFLIDESFPLDYSRNKACEIALECDAEFILMLDADMVFQRRTIPYLLESASLGFRVVTGNYHKKSSPHQSVAGWYVANDIISPSFLDAIKEWGFQTEQGQQTLIYRSCTDFSGPRPYQVDVSGAGCLLIHKSVFTQLKQPYFRYFDPYLNGPSELGLITEDMHFFSECKKGGIKVILDPRIQCGHLTEREVLFFDQEAPHEPTAYAPPPQRRSAAPSDAHQGGTQDPGGQAQESLVVVKSLDPETGEFRPCS